MTLTNEQKEKISSEYEAWKEQTYGGITIEERKKLGAFHTPSELTIKLIEKLDTLDDKIIDPCAGSGNLIAGAILAGADPKRCYANELSTDIYNVMTKRLSKLGVPMTNMFNMDVFDQNLWNKIEGKSMFGVKRAK